jgi:uncharacterized membrane protein
MSQPHQNPQRPQGQPPPPGWSDERVEQVVGNLLRFGVLLAAVVILAGGILYLWESGGGGRADRRIFRGEPADLRSPVGIVADALAGESLGLIQLGMLLLIATPVARVVFSAYAFLRQSDWVYVVVTLIVLAVLLFSLFNTHLALEVTG